MLLESFSESLYLCLSLLFFIYCLAHVCVYMCVHAYAYVCMCAHELSCASELYACHSTHVDVRGWLLGGGFLLPCGFWDFRRLGHKHLCLWTSSSICLCLYLGMFITMSGLKVTSPCECLVSPAQFVKEIVFCLSLLYVLVLLSKTWPLVPCGFISGSLIHLVSVFLCAVVIRVVTDSWV